jgi:hypothetical protein
MRRLLFSLLAMTFMGAVVGCHATHGVCDCSCDYDDNCSYRAPWTHESGMKSETPAPIPEMKEALPNGPKKL